MRASCSSSSWSWQSRSLAKVRDEKAKKGEKPVPADVLLRYMDEAADAIDYLNAKGIQHRDIKPENIMLSSADRIKIADFGLAKLLEGGAVVIRAESRAFTPIYAAPEVWDNRLSDHTDQYSLAITYYEMSTGKPPFASSQMNLTSIMRADIEGNLQFEQLAGQPCQEQVLRKATAKDPDDRFPNCRTFVSALRKAINDDASDFILPSDEDLTTAAPSLRDTQAGELTSGSSPSWPTRTIQPVIDVPKLKPVPSGRDTERHPKNAPTERKVPALSPSTAPVPPVPSVPPTTTPAATGASWMSKAMIALCFLALVGAGGVYLGSIIKRDSRTAEEDKEPPVPPVIANLPGSKSKNANEQRPEPTDKGKQKKLDTLHQEDTANVADKGKQSNGGAGKNTSNDGAGGSKGAFTTPKPLSDDKWREQIAEGYRQIIDSRQAGNRENNNNDDLQSKINSLQADLKLNVRTKQREARTKELQDLELLREAVEFAWSKNLIAPQRFNFDNIVTSFRNAEGDRNREEAAALTLFWLSVNKSDALGSPESLLIRLDDLATITSRSEILSLFNFARAIVSSKLPDRMDQSAHYVLSAYKLRPNEHRELEQEERKAQASKLLLDDVRQIKLAEIDFLENPFSSDDVVKKIQTWFSLAAELRDKSQEAAFNKPLPSDLGKTWALAKWFGQKDPGACAELVNRPNINPNDFGPYRFLVYWVAAQEKKVPADKRLQWYVQIISEIDKKKPLSLGDKELFDQVCLKAESLIDRAKLDKPLDARVLARWPISSNETNGRLGFVRASNWQTQNGKPC